MSENIPGQAHPQTPHQDERMFQLHRIYIKDLSFESPKSPQIFLGEWQPKHELSLNTQVKRIDDLTFEVVLTVTVTTHIGDQTAFIVEVHQAGLVGVTGFAETDLGPLLGAYCPNLLFPYAREAISDLVTKGSFPQLLLQPVNFEVLYAQRQRQMMEEMQKQGGTTPPSSAIN
jgi:preprotein translocase subunit SecB